MSSVLSDSKLMQLIPVLYVPLEGFQGGLVVKNLPANAEDGDVGSIPGLGRSPGGEHSNPLQYSCLENPHGQRILAGYSPWGRKESDMAERLSTVHSTYVKWLANTSNPSYYYCLYFVVRTFKVYFLRNFQVYKKDCKL